MVDSTDNNNPLVKFEAHEDLADPEGKKNVRKGEFFIQ